MHIYFIKNEYIYKYFKNTFNINNNTTKMNYTITERYDFKVIKILSCYINIYRILYLSFASRGFFRAIRLLKSQRAYFSKI